MKYYFLIFIFIVYLISYIISIKYITENYFFYIYFFLIVIFLLVIFFLNIDRIKKDNIKTLIVFLFIYFVSYILFKNIITFFHTQYNLINCLDVSYSEEISKIMPFLIFVLFSSKNDVKGFNINYILFASLSFGIIEFFIYISKYYYIPYLIFIRFLIVFIHIVYTYIFYKGLSLFFNNKKILGFSIVLISLFLHFLYDFAVYNDFKIIAAIIFNLILLFGLYVFLKFLEEKNILNKIILTKIKK